MQPSEPSSDDCGGASMVDERARLGEMLADLEGYLDGLREKQGVTEAEYLAEDDLQDIVERRLQKATQTCIDAGRRTGRIEGRDLSEATNADVLAALVDLGVLPESHRQEFVEIGGLRNVLAHRYRHVDDTEIYDVYDDLDRLERFSEAVYRYLHDDSRLPIPARRQLRRSCVATYRRSPRRGQLSAARDYARPYGDVRFAKRGEVGWRVRGETGPLRPARGRRGG